MSGSGVLRRVKGLSRHYPAPSSHEKMVIGLLPKPLMSGNSNMALRIAAAAVVALGLAGVSGPVSAQIFVPGYPSAAAQPPVDIPDVDDDDLVEAAPPIQSGP